MTTNKEIHDARSTHVSIGWSFWLQWVLVTTIGWLVGWFVMDWLYMAVSLFATGAVIGALVGAMQWLVLRRQVSRSGGWILMTAAGGTVSGVAIMAGAMVGIVDVGGAAAGALGGAIIGALIGILQWFTLRRKIYRAGWWMLASTVGGAVGGLLIPGWGIYPILAAMGALPGAITGGLLVWLLRHPVSQQRDNESDRSAPQM